jgi:hypothetical protein
MIECMCDFVCLRRSTHCLATIAPPQLFEGQAYADVDQIQRPAADLSLNSHVFFLGLV